MAPEAFVERLGQEKASAILRTDDQDKASLAMKAAVRGGFTIVEFTLTTGAGSFTATNIPSGMDRLMSCWNRWILSPAWRRWFPAHD